MSQKQLLIDTVFRGLDIPKFYVWKVDLETLNDGYPAGETREFYKQLLRKKMDDNDDPAPYIYEVVDGQQRIRTFLEYMGVKPKDEKTYRGTWHDPFKASPETPMAKGRLYSLLNTDQQTIFDECMLTVMVLEKAKIDEIRDMFLRLQNGTPLNSQQKRDGVGSDFGKASKSLANLPFFSKSLPFDNANSDHVLLASQMMLLAAKGKVVNCTSKQLNKEYKHYTSNTVDPEVTKKADRNIKLLGDIFPTPSHHLNKSYALSLFWLFHELDNQYTIPATELPKIRTNFEKLNLARLEADNREYSQDGDSVFEDLTEAMSNSRGGADNISKVQEILAQFLLIDVNLLLKPKLDSKRAFTFEERAILYGRCGGVCQLSSVARKVCGRNLEFDESVVDHVIPHSMGGETQLANGRIALDRCNSSRGVKNDFDPATMCCMPVEATTTTAPAAIP